MRFGTRLALFLVAVLIGVQALTVATGYFVSRRQLVERGQAQLARAAKVFEAELHLVMQPVTDGVAVLALDFPLRQAIAQQDMMTTDSVLRNHGDRIGAQRMFLIGLDGAVAIDTGASPLANRKFQFPQLLDLTAANGQAAGLAVLDGKLQWLMAAPVNAPTPIAYLAAAVPVDDRLIASLRDLYVLPLSIDVRTGAGAALAFAGAGVDPRQERLKSSLTLSTLNGSEPAIVEFEHPLSEAVRPFEAVLWPLLVISLLGLGVAVAGAVAIARRVSQPIENLAQHAERIKGGDYASRAPIEGSGEVRRLGVALRAMAHAIEERRMALEASHNEAVRANKAKSEFLANMSHEIRTPLNAVLGLAGVLIDSPLSAEQRHQVGLIKESGGNLLSLLNDILDLSKLEAGQVELDKAPFDPAALTRDSVELLRARAAEKGVDLSVELRGELPPAMTGDSSRVRQVLINLVGNAIKFTQKGDVKVTARVVSTAGGSATMEWSVADSGIGIPAERVGSLFKEFVQADSSISRRFGGTGLGLAICKRLVESMGGAIGVTSVEGRGSTFSFQAPFPLADAPAASTQIANAVTEDLTAFVAGRGQGVRILVVEDNVTNQFVARSILAVEGVEVDLASDGAEAVEAVARRDYDLVFMDMQMPEMDGLTATRLIRARGGRCAEVPIIAFSANAFTSDVEACVRAGMNGHVAKPVQKETLQGAVVDVLSGRACGVGPGAGRASDGADAPAFDRNQVQQLVEGLTEAVVQDLLVSFLKDTKAKLERLPGMLGETKRLTVEVHALKSAGAQVGALALSRLAATLEKRAVSGDAIDERDLAALRQALEAYQDWLQREHFVAAEAA